MDAHPATIGEYLGSVSNGGRRDLQELQDDGGGVADTEVGGY